MAKIQKFKQFNSINWIGPLEILDIKDNTVYTNFGNFKNSSGSNLTVGYSYILRVENEEIVETGMSCVDLVILVRSGWGYKVLSIKRGKEPFKGMWANPGGNIDEGEKPIDAAVRELEEETGLKLPKENFEYVGAFDKPWRDPRNKNCVSHAFKVILNECPDVTAGDDATECTWNEVDHKGDMRIKMAFDHNEVIKKAVTTLI
jgi:8-oxo-dGTP diphosphatase